MIVLRTTDTQTNVIFDSEVAAQFLRHGEIIERKGYEIRVLHPERNDWARKISFAYQNDLGGIIGATIDYDVMVPVGTVVEHVKITDRKIPR